MDAFFELLLSKEFLGALAIAVGLFGYVFYVRGIIRGKVKPHAFTWFVWGLLTSIAFVAQIHEGGGAGAWVTGFTALASFIFAAVGLGATSRIFIAKSDWVIFISTLFALPIWYFTQNPLWSVVLVSIIDAVAFVPTFRKTFYNPETENMWTYLLSGLKFLIAIIALQNVTVTTVLYPASLVLANVLFVVFLLWRKNSQKHV